MNDSIRFTLDLEDHRPDDSAELRYPAVVHRLLDDLDRWRVRGTVFVVGALAAQSPRLIREIVSRGHEIGLHGADHTPLTGLGPQRFRREVSVATEALAELAGAPIAGFRAPIFSLVPETRWAPEVLTELGYEYSSSVLPARNPLYGWPGAPRRPFRWPCGLVEFPAPVMGAGPLRLPLLGGTYLRAAPAPLVRWARWSQRGHPALWLYAHPYDFDPGEPRWVVPEAGRLGSLLLWHGRKTMSKRVRALVQGADETLRDTARRFAHAAVFDPGAPRGMAEAPPHRSGAQTVVSGPSARRGRADAASQSRHGPCLSRSDAREPEDAAVSPEGLPPTGGAAETAHGAADAAARHWRAEGSRRFGDAGDAGADDADAGDGEYSGADMIHRLPRAGLVDRADFIVEACRSKRVIHVGFADAGFRRAQQRAGAWLHARIAASAAELVGIDADRRGVEEARAAGWDACLADAADPAEIRALGLAPADVVVAGEVIEHVASPGALLDSLRAVCRADGRLIVTTPNAAGILNSLAVVLRGVELNHPDHVVTFTPRTLCELLRRQGWRVLHVAVYVPEVRSRSGGGRIDRIGVRALLAVERLLARLGRPFAAEGLIVVAAPDDQAPAWSGCSTPESSRRARSSATSSASV